MIELTQGLLEEAWFRMNGAQRVLVRGDPAPYPWSGARHDGKRLDRVPAQARRERSARAVLGAIVVSFDDLRLQLGTHAALLEPVESYPGRDRGRIR